MTHLGGMGGTQLDAVDMTAFQPTSEEALIQMQQAHSESESVRQLAERIYNQRQRPSDKTSIARFELHKETGLIEVLVYDAESGQVSTRLSPDEVMRGFEGLEETRENDAPLSSFFIDISM